MRCHSIHTRGQFLEYCQYTSGNHKPGARGLSLRDQLVDRGGTPNAPARDFLHGAAFHIVDDALVASLARRCTKLAPIRPNPIMPRFMLTRLP